MERKIKKDVRPAKQGQAVRIEFKKTKINILIPILIATCALTIELLSLYYFNSGNSIDFAIIFHLINTTFIPTHIATTTCFLYEHFSQANWLFSKVVDWNASGKVLRPQYTTLTVTSTCILAFFYVILNIRVTLVSQLLLVVLQVIYMVILVEVELEDRVLIYEMPVKNVVAGR